MIRKKCENCGRRRDLEKLKVLSVKKVLFKKYICKKNIINLNIKKCQ
jgi:hypothetical protein